MRTAARAASRSAGRGARLPTAPKPKPVTQLPSRRRSPAPSSGAGRGTPLNCESAIKRSSLTSSVLRRSNPAGTDKSRLHRLHDSDHFRSQSRYYEKSSSGRSYDLNSKRKTNDWYSSAARREALAGLAQATSELAEVSKRPNEEAQLTQPFAWADLSDVAKQLPDGHWAHGYVSSVASYIEWNDAMDGKQKEKVLGEVLQALGRLSRENDERFQDAES